MSAANEADEPPVLGEVRGCAGILTLNRPRVLNALSIPMFALLPPLSKLRN